MPTAPTIQTQQGPSESFNADSTAHNITITTLTNGILIIHCAFNGGTPQTPTVDASTTGVTLLAEQLMPSPNGGWGVRTYYKIAPGTGTKAISFQSTGATSVALISEAYNNVHPTIPFGTPVKSSGSNTATLSANVATAVGYVVIDVVQWLASGHRRTATVGAGQTARNNGSGNTHGFATSDETATGTTTTMSWTLTSSATPTYPNETPTWAGIAVVLNGFDNVLSGALSAAGTTSPAFVGNWRSGQPFTMQGSSPTTFVGVAYIPPVQRNYMSKGNTFETDILGLIFNATAIANLAINATASPLTNLFVALHTADPGEAGDQTTNETAYTGYARQSVARTGAGFVVSAGTVAPANNIDFPVCTASPGTTITHASIGVAVSGASKILYSGPISPQIAIAVGVIPRLTTASLVTED